MKHLCVMLLVAMLLLPIHATTAQTSPATFVTCDRQVQFDYPAGWYTEEYPGSIDINRPLVPQTSLIVLSNHLPFRRADDLINDMHRIEIRFMPAPVFSGFGSVLSATTPDQLPYQDVRDYGEIAFFVLNHPIAQVSYTTTNNAGDENTGFFVVMALPRSEVWITAEASSSQQEMLAQHFQLILDSFVFAPATATDEEMLYVSQDCGLRWIYPADWLLQTGFASQVVFFESWDAQDARLKNRAYTGTQFEVEIIRPRNVARFLGDLLDNTDLTAEAVLAAYATLEGLTLSEEATWQTIGAWDVLQAPVEDGFVWVLAMPEDTMMIVALRGTAPGIADAAAQVRTLIQSVQYDQSPLDS